MWNHTAAFFKQMHHQAKTKVLDESGVTSIEYALIGALIAAVIALSVTQLGLIVKALFESVAF